MYIYIYIGPYAGFCVEGFPYKIVGPFYNCLVGQPK